MSVGQNIDTEEQTIDDPEVLAAQVELLEAENDRLRSELSSARQTRYRRAATGMAAVGVGAVVSAILFPAASTVLIALGGTGLFLTVLIRYLTPERFISATVGPNVYKALSANQKTLADELALTDDRVYVPLEDKTGSGVRLFVPQHAEYVVPDDEELRSVLVLPTDDQGRGVAFEPTGNALVEELRSATGGGLHEDLGTLADQLADGLIEIFELVDRAESDVDSDNGRLSIEVTDSAYGPVDRFDHPVASTIATAVAAERNRPVTLEVTESTDGIYIVTCRLE